MTKRTLTKEDVVLLTEVPKTEEAYTDIMTRIYTKKDDYPPFDDFSVNFIFTVINRGRIYLSIFAIKSLQEAYPEAEVMTYKTFINTFAPKPQEETLSQNQSSPKDFLLNLLAKKHQEEIEFINNLSEEEIHKYLLSTFSPK